MCETRCNEHNNPNKDSEAAKHIRQFPEHAFDLKILSTAPNNTRLRKTLGRQLGNHSVR